MADYAPIYTIFSRPNALRKETLYVRHAFPQVSVIEETFLAYAVLKNRAFRAFSSISYFGSCISPEKCQIGACIERDSTRGVHAKQNSAGRTQNEAARGRTLNAFRGNTLTKPRQT